MRLLRELVWAWRMRNADWDVRYYRSGIQHFERELRKAEAKLERIAQSRVDVDYPVRGM